LEDQGNDHRGILILDEINPKRTLIHSKEHLNYRFGNPNGKKYHRIVETPFFVNSLYSPGIQMADLFAAIIRRQEEMMTKGEYCKYTNTLYQRVFRKTYQTIKTTENGFKITGYDKPFK